MTWLGPLPFDVPFLPGLTGTVLLWTIPFLGSALFVLPLASRAWHGYLTTRRVPDARAERAYALGQAIARTCGLVMVLAGLAAGLVVAVTPPTLPRRPLKDSAVALILALLLLAVLVAVQSIALQFSQRAAEAILAKAAAERAL